VCVLCAAIVVVVNLISQLFAMTFNRNLNIIYLSMKNMPPAAAQQQSCAPFTLTLNPVHPTIRQNKPSSDDGSTNLNKTVG